MNKLHSTQQKFNELVKQMDTLHLSEDGTVKGGFLSIQSLSANKVKERPSFNGFFCHCHEPVVPKGPTTPSAPPSYV